MRAGVVVAAEPDIESRTLMGAPSAAARLRCSYAADERGDPLAGTAAHANGFLLIEAPGAWGQNALSESRLDPEIANVVAARAAELSYRVLLIKRPGRAAVEPRRAWAVVDSTPGAERTTWGSYASDRELLDIPLERPSRPWRAPASATLYLVCTHGRHDACCALRGRAVAARLAAHRPGQVWECSHIGGDRFAPERARAPARALLRARRAGPRPRHRRRPGARGGGGRSPARPVGLPPAGPGRPALREARPRQRR